MLDCYRLAHFFHQSPTVFLTMPLSEVRTHKERTARLMELQAKARAPSPFEEQ